MVTRLTDSVRKSDPDSSMEFLDAVDKALAESEEKYAELIVDLMDQNNKPVLGVSMVMYEEDNTVYPVKGKKYKGVFYPTPEQAQILAQTFGCCRVVWNHMLSFRSEEYPQ